MESSRRQFIKKMAALSAAVTTASLSPSAHANPLSAPLQTLPTRKFGRANIPVTALCVGGAHVGAHMDSRSAETFLNLAFDKGIRFFDNAESYSGGESEIRFGKYLKPAWRSEIFLMTKTRATNRSTAERHLSESLARMKTDYLDLWQMHDLSSARDVDGRIQNGVLDFMLEAKAAGKVRYVGFTGHTRPEAFIHLLKRLKELGIELDAAQMPINIVDPHYESFTLTVLPTLIERNYAVLAMKTLVYGQLAGKNSSWRGDRRADNTRIVGEVVTLAEALGFVWSLPITTLVSGMTNARELQENADICRDFPKLNQAQRDAIVAKVEAFSGPQMEFYKA
jgi:aryl-alcohol dehydrogenase-like predicted oxidoreductase